MLFTAFAAILTTLHISTVLGSQVPVVDGIIGGVPTGPVDKVKLATRPGISTVTPGALRIVENSGVCGMLCVGNVSQTVY